MKDTPYCSRATRVLSHEEILLTCSSHTKKKKKQKKILLRFDRRLVNRVRNIDIPQGEAACRSRMGRKRTERKWSSLSIVVEYDTSLEDSVETIITSGWPGELICRAWSACWSRSNDHQVNSTLDLLRSFRTGLHNK